VKFNFEKELSRNGKLTTSQRRKEVEDELWEVANVTGQGLREVAEALMEALPAVQSGLRVESLVDRLHRHDINCHFSNRKRPGLELVLGR
jgi:hypothetical protein